MAKVQQQDIASVGARVSWSAILAGALVALAVSLALSGLGVALGLTLSDDVGGEGFAIGAAVYAALTMLVSLFLGGFIASRTTAGETKGEALTYGVLVWGVLFIIIPITLGLGVTSSFGELLASANAPRGGEPNPALADQLRQAGIDDAQIEKVRSIQSEARKDLPDVGPTAAAWWALAGTFGSLLAAVFGAIAGAGPELVFAAIYRRTAVVTRPS